MQGAEDMGQFAGRYEPPPLSLKGLEYILFLALLNNVSVLQSEFYPLRAFISRSVRDVWGSLFLITFGKKKVLKQQAFHLYKF